MPDNKKKNGMFDTLPHSLESENTIIGSIIMGETKYLRMLTPAHFYDKTNGLIFHTMQKIQEEGRVPDFLETIDALKGSEIDKLGGSAFIADIISSVPSTALAVSAVRLVQEKFSKRAAIEAGRKIQAIAEDNEFDVRKLPQMMAEASRKISEILPRPLEIDKDAIIADLQKIDDKLPTGFPQMDLLLGGGLEGGWVFLVAARPSVGKSAMASTMMANFLKAHVPVSFISLEMSQKQVMKRMLCAYYEVMPEEALEKAEDLVNRIETPYWINQNSDLSSILQEIYTSPAKVIIIDYFGLITMKSKEGSVEKLDEISRSIKLAAMESGKPVILLWQLNREVEKDKANRQPRLSDLYGGGEKDPDQISFLHDPNAKDELGVESPTIREALAVVNPVKDLEWIVKKNRHGATGYMRLKFEQKKSLMTEDLTPFVKKEVKTEPVRRKNWKEKDEHSFNQWQA